MSGLNAFTIRLTRKTSLTNFIAFVLFFFMFVMLVFGSWNEFIRWIISLFGGETPDL